jgi:hypothetical protein
MLVKNSQLNIKSHTIPISIKKQNIDFNIENKNQYSLKQNLFDPTKSSPPNDFMIKLYSRLIHYDNIYHKKEGSFDNK